MVHHLMGPWTDNKLEEAAIGLLALFFFFYQNCRKKTSLKKNCIGLQDKGQVVFEKRQKNSVASEVQVVSIGLNFDGSLVVAAYCQTSKRFIHRKIIQNGTLNSSQREKLEN